MILRHGFFFMYTWMCWSLPGRYLQLPSTTKIIKFFKKVYSDLPGRYLQLPAATKNIHIFKSVYWLASYLELPPATSSYPPATPSYLQLPATSSYRQLRSFSMLLKRCSK